MDIKDYIQSGVLELYVLDQLSEMERLEVETMRVQYPDVNVEIIAIEESLEALAFANQKTPPPFLKKAILDEIKNEVNKSNDVTKTPKLVASRTAFYWAVAASIVGIISTLATLFYSSQLHDVKNELATLQHQQEIHKQELAVLKNVDFKQIHLAKVDSTKNIQPANLYWNKTSQEVYITWNNKEPLPADKQYQLWAIVDGKPVDAGVFDINDSLQQMKRIAGASAFAVTIEKKGGSVSPTLSAMVVMGAI